MQKILIFGLFALIGCSKPWLSKMEPPHHSKKFNVIWSKNLDPEYETGNLPIGFSTPVIYSGLVYQPAQDGTLNVYEIETGRPIWNVKEEQPLGAQVGILGDYIYYGGYGGRLFVRHYLTSDLKYSVDLGAPIESNPVFYQGRAIIHLRNHKIVCLDAETGKIFWTYKRAVTFTSTLQRVSRILPYNNKFIVGFADGHVGSLSMEEGLLEWELKITHQNKFVDVDIDPVIFGGKLIIGAATGPLSFIDPNSGLLEKTLPLAPGHTPIIHEGKLYIGSMDGSISVLSSEGIRLKEKKISKDGISSIVAWKQGLAVSFFAGKILFVDPSTLEAKERFELGSEYSSIFGSLVESKGYLAAYSSRNRLYVFQ